MVFDVCLKLIFFADQPVVTVAGEAYLDKLRINLVSDHSKMQPNLPVYYIGSLWYKFFFIGSSAGKHCRIALKRQLVYFCDVEGRQDLFDSTGMSTKHNQDWLYFAIHKSSSICVETCFILK